MRDQKSNKKIQKMKTLKEIFLDKKLKKRDYNVKTPKIKK